GGFDGVSRSVRPGRAAARFPRGAPGPRRSARSRRDTLLTTRRWNAAWLRAEREGSSQARARRSRCGRSHGISGSGLLAPGRPPQEDFANRFLSAESKPLVVRGSSTALGPRARTSSRPLLRREPSTLGAPARKRKWPARFARLLAGLSLPRSARSFALNPASSSCARVLVRRPSSRNR